MNMAPPKHMSGIQRIMFHVEKLLEPLLYSRFINQRVEAFLRNISLETITKLLTRLM